MSPIPPRKGDTVACTSCGLVSIHDRHLALCGACGRLVETVASAPRPASRPLALFARIAGARTPA